MKKTERFFSVILVEKPIKFKTEKGGCGGNDYDVEEHEDDSHEDNVKIMVTMNIMKIIK